MFTKYKPQRCCTNVGKVKKLNVYDQEGKITVNQKLKYFSDRENVIPGFCFCSWQEAFRVEHISY